MRQTFIFGFRLAETIGFPIVFNWSKHFSKDSALLMYFWRWALGRLCHDGPAQGHLCAKTIWILIIFMWSNRFPKRMRLGGQAPCIFILHNIQCVDEPRDVLFCFLISGALCACYLHHRRKCRLHISRPVASTWGSPFGHCLHLALKQPCPSSAIKGLAFATKPEALTAKSKKRWHLAQNDPFLFACPLRGL